MTSTKLTRYPCRPKLQNSIINIYHSPPPLPEDTGCQPRNVHWRTVARHRAGTSLPLQSPSHSEASCALWSHPPTRLHWDVAGYSCPGHGLPHDWFLGRGWRGGRWCMLTGGREPGWQMRLVVHSLTPLWWWSRSRTMHIKRERDEDGREGGGWEK